MIIVTLVPNERWVGQRCPNCPRPFKAGDRIFESVDQTVGIHVPCVVSLALLAELWGPKRPTAEEVEIEYRQTREGLLNDSDVT
jgi:hypothetical protein